MKKLKLMMVAGMFGAVAATPGLAADTPDPLTTAFGATVPEVERLTDEAMADYRGRFAQMLLLPLSIAAVDLALIGTYWGLYLPRYGGGSCLSCTTGTDLH
jgi:hypothetical protein